VRTTILEPGLAVARGCCRGDETGQGRNRPCPVSGTCRVSWGGASSTPPERHGC